MEQSLESNKLPTYEINHFNGLGNLNRKRVENIQQKTELTTNDFYQIIDRNDTKETIAYRPMTSNAFRVPYNLGDPIGPSHYDSQYYHKTVKKEEPIRSGTSSGYRSNNPHPSQEFMVFRFRPLKLIKNQNSDWSQPIGDKLITQVIQSQMKTTYATDYVNNFEEKAKFEEKSRQQLRLSTPALKSHWKTQKELDQKNAIAPFQYNSPFTYESIYLSPSRYGSNMRHKQSAVGIVPGCSKFWTEISKLNKMN